MKTYLLALMICVPLVAAGFAHAGGAVCAAVVFRQQQEVM